MNIKFIIAVVVLTAIALFFTFSSGKSDEITTQPSTALTTSSQAITSATDPTQVPTSTEDVSVAVTAPSEKLSISAPQAGLYNLTTGKVLYEKAAKKKISPASLTKILTAITALTYMKSDTVITVGSELDILPKHSSICLISKGHRLTLYDLLTGMLVSSGNDAAYTVAVNVARHVSSDKLNDREALSYFVSLMNGIADLLGCTNSNFKTPDGYDAEGQYTTVQDLSLIYTYALNFKEIREIVSIDQKKVVFASGENITWSNTNKLLHKDNAYYFPAAIGMKTGTTTKAGHCLIAAAKINSQIFLCVVTGGKDDDQRYKSALKLLDSIEA